jgi:hypothetical protein
LWVSAHGYHSCLRCSRLWVSAHVETVDCGFQPMSRQTKDYQIGTCCFSAKHTSLRSESKEWLAWN